jgi:hypothetical protein
MNIFRQRQAPCERRESVEARNRRLFYAEICRRRLLTVEEALAARPDLLPLQAIAADHKTIWQALREKSPGAARPCARPHGR